MKDVLARLSAQRDELRVQLRDVEATLAGIRDARSDSTADDEHDPEGSTLSADWSLNAGLRAATIAALGDAEAALARLDAGTYGFCLRCEQPIAAARLDARPAAALCIVCAAS